MLRKKGGKEESGLCIVNLNTCKILKIDHPYLKEQDEWIVYTQ